MTVSGVSFPSAQLIQSLVDQRTELDDLSRQLSTGQKVTTYAGISSQAQLLVGLNSQLNTIGGFQSNNGIVNSGEPGITGVTVTLTGTKSRTATRATRWAGPRLSAPAGRCPFTWSARSSTSSGSEPSSISLSPRPMLWVPGASMQALAIHGFRSVSPMPFVS